MFSKIVATLFATLITILTVSGCGSSSTTPHTDTPVPLRGSWHMTNASDGSFDMTAHIVDHQIQITWVSDDTKALYWKGTFPTDVMKDDVTIVSKGDRQALDASMLGSQDKTKKFHYDNGVLSYEFSVMGVSKTIHLEK